MVAGGGASVIFADTIVEKGGVSELANYGEYSGAPNEGQVSLFNVVFKSTGNKSLGYESILKICDEVICICAQRDNIELFPKILSSRLTNMPRRSLT